VDSEEDNLDTEQEYLEYNDAPAVETDYRKIAKVHQLMNSDGTFKTVIKAKRSDFVASLLHLNGEPFSFSGRDYLLPVYNSPDRNILLKTARQVEKSTFLGNYLSVNAAVKAYNKALYVSPSHSQTRQFSNEKLKPSIEQSPLIKKYLQDSSVSQQVFEKSMTNGSIIFLRSAFRTADRTRGISAADLCYDKDAYVLTMSGWKKAYDITLNDYIADVNDSGAVEWNRPSKIIKKQHTGKMITFSHAGFHLRVTDNHNMWVNFKVKPKKQINTEDKFVFKTAGELFNNDSMGFKFSCKANWGAESPEFMFINNKPYPFKEFCSLLGWYLAEGSISGGYPVLTINKEKDLKHLQPSLDAIKNISGYAIYKDPNSEHCVKLWIFCKSLGSYFKKLGTSYNKYIPRDLLQFPDGVEEILKGLFLGDACYHKGELWENGTLRTRSKQLAEDVQEAWLRLGHPSVIHVRMSPNKALNLTPDVPYDVVPLYEVCAYTLDYMIFWNSQKSKRLSEEYVENEEVYCFTVKNHRPIVKGNYKSKPVICGNCLDEIQDFLGSEIPVIMECTSHFPEASLIMAGTPKSFDNPIESYWQQSTQNEWIVKCQHCNHFNFLDDTNIAPTEFYRTKKLPPGPVCSKCHKPIDVPKWGKWMTLSPGKRLQGYRIPQIMVPWIIRTYDQWERLLWKRDNYPLGQFYNEVLGLSYDSASKPITRAELINCCDASLKMLPDRPDAYAVEAAKKMILIGGVDWGEGNDGSEKSPTGKLRTASYTVFTIGTYVNQKQFKVVYMKKYTGAEVDPDYVVKDIARLCQAYNVRLIGADWGHGWGVNNHLVRILGPQRVVQFQYLPKQREKMKWDPIGFKYQVQRNLIISEMFYSMKHGEMVFPAWSQFEMFAKDILAVFVEYVEFQRQMKYDHKPSDPDDSLHSIIYARLAANIFFGKKHTN
jgi:hypothetical protein